MMAFNSLHSGSLLCGRVQYVLHWLPHKNRKNHGRSLVATQFGVKLKLFLLQLHPSDLLSKQIGHVMLRFHQTVASFEDPCTK